MSECTVVHTLTSLSASGMTEEIMISEARQQTLRNEGGRHGGQKKKKNDRIHQSTQSSHNISTLAKFSSPQPWTSSLMQMCFSLRLFQSFFPFPLSSDLVFCSKQQGELAVNPNPSRHEPVDPVVRRLAEG